MRSNIKNNKGFSLAELMVVVTIICILFGVIAINVIQYRKKLRQLAYDSNAEIILEAAQNRLTELFAAEGPNAFQKSGIHLSEVTGTTEGEKLFYIDDTGAAAAAYLFPARSLSEEIRAKHWRVEFDPETGIAYAAFYSAEPGDSLYDEAARIKDGNGYRHDAKVGYCGYGDEGPAIENYQKMKDYSVKLSLVNKDILKAIAAVKVPNGTGAALSFVIRGEESGKEETFTLDPSDPSAYPNITVTPRPDADGTVYQCSVILDSFDPAHAFRFRELCPKLAPGENITISVYASFTGTNVEDTPPVTARTNSLFADFKGNTAYVRYGRHLQNLDSGTSGVGAPGTGSGVTTEVNVTNVIQEKSIDFTMTGEDLWAALYPQTYTGNSWLSSHGYRAFTPIDNEDLTGTFIASAENADGVQITGLLATAEPGVTHGGLFETFRGTAVTGIHFTGAYVDSPGSAGAFAGTVSASSVTFTDCSSVLLYPDYSVKNTSGVKINANELQWITAGTGGHAGGLVGASTGALIFKGCYASSVINAPYGAAGGLFGSAGTASITNSYADSYVFGSAGSGGLGGAAASATITSSYSAGFLYKPSGTGVTAHAGGYIPGITGTDASSTVESSYSIFDTSQGVVTAGGVTDSIPACDYAALIAAEGSRFTGEDSAVLPINPTALTTPYNICPNGETYEAYEYPMLKISGSSTKVMRHYGDWNGVKGYSVRFHTVGYNESDALSVVETCTVKVKTDENKTFADVAVGKDAFQINTAAEGQISLLLAENVNTGWYKEPECLTPFTPEEIAKAIDGDMDVYAKWQCAVNYSSSVSFPEGGVPVVLPADPVIYGSRFGSLSGPEQSEFGVAETTAHIEPATWYKSYDGAAYDWGGTENRFKASDRITADTTAYAKWFCDVTFDAAVDAISEDTYTEENVPYGTLFASVDKPSGSAFVGEESSFILDDYWYKESDYTKTASVDRTDEGLRITADTVVYARWKCPVIYHSALPSLVEKETVNESVLGNDVYYGTSLDLSKVPTAAQFNKNEPLITREELKLGGNWYSAPPTGYQYDETKKMVSSVAVYDKMDVYAQWKIKVTYKTSSTQDDSETKTDRYVAAKRDDECSDFVLLGTSYRDIVPSAESDFLQTPFDLDRDPAGKVQWYKDDSIAQTAKFDTNQVVTESSIRTLYAKYDGIVLRTKLGGSEFIVYKSGPELTDGRLVPYTFNQTTTELTNKKGKLCSYTFDTWGTGDETDFTSVFSVQGYSFSSFERVDGIQIYGARWDEVVDYSDVSSGQGNARYGYTGLTAFTDGGTYILANSNKGSNKNCSAIGISTSGTVSSITVPMEPSGGSGGNAFIPVAPTSKSKVPAPVETLWKISREGSGYVIRSVKDNSIYLGLNASGQLTAIRSSDPLFESNIRWDISTTGSGKDLYGTMKITIDSGTWYIDFSNASATQSPGTSAASADSTPKVYLYGTEYESDSQIN